MHVCIVRVFVRVRECVCGRARVICSALDGSVRFYSLKTGAETAVIRVPGVAIYRAVCVALRGTAA